MAYLDNADLLARAKVMAQRPATDEDMTDAAFYSLLTEAQDYWVKVIAQHAPNLVSTAPTQMTTADSGLTYTVGTDQLAPVAILELTDGKGGRKIRFGSYDDSMTEATFEGSFTIRMARNTARSFSNGLWIRYVAQPTVIDGSTAPSLPVFCRLVLVPRACYLWATRGGYRDPSPYLLEEQKLWSGDPNMPGDFGLLGLLKKRQNIQQSGRSGSDPWYLSPDLG